jgi:hypothetical protein
MTSDQSLEKHKLALSTKCHFALRRGARCIAIHHWRTTRSAVFVAARRSALHLLMHHGHGKHKSDSRPH